MSFCAGIFNQGGDISLHLDNYEVRPQQIEMVKAVEEAIEADKNLIIEAGTGVGKTLAYLTPFIFWSKNNQKRVVISTYTKALQNQLFVKDLPFLKKALDLDFNFALCLGADNYVCLRKANKITSLDMFQTERKKQQAQYILEWIKRTDTGVVTDMEILPDRSVWKIFSRDPELCPGNRCKYCEHCFHKRSRIEQSQSEVLITNHSLLFTDVVSGSKVLPEYHAIVLDEAHTVEDIATNHFAKEISKAGLNVFLTQVRMLLKNIKNDDMEDNVSYFQEVYDLVEFISKGQGLFNRAAQLFGKNDGFFKFDNIDFLSDLEIMHQLISLSESLGVLAPGIKDPEKSEEIKSFAGRSEKMAESIDFIFNEQKYDYAHWLDIRSAKNEINYSFHAAPVNISDHMREYFFDKISPVVITSATLTSGKDDFSFIKERLGLSDPLELVLDSPFDYKKNVMLYLPETKVDPVRNIDGYKKHLKQNIIEIYEVMGGRIFCLFTSYEMLNYISLTLNKERPDIELLRQGDMPRYVLLDVFKRNPSSMLMGTSTFWQGVDVPGEALEGVIITKFPFSVPTDPVNAARIEVIRSNGGQPFTEYQLPQAVIMFKQGFGRLIRTRKDRGIVAILDPRIKTRSYGKSFIEALPECKKAQDIKEIASFFRKNILL